MTIRKEIESVLSKYISDSQDLHVAVERIVAIKSGKTRRDDKVNAALSDAELIDYPSYELKESWMNWIRYKGSVKNEFYAGLKAQESAFSKLLRNDSRFSVALIENAIDNQYSGFHFVNTPSSYEQWKRSASTAISAKEARFAAAIAKTA